MKIIVRIALFGGSKAEYFSAGMEKKVSREKFGNENDILSPS
jgi:hypothetical protein